MIQGSNNPFSCSPVVFSAGNSIISLGTITRVGNVFTFSVGFVWTINGTIYQNTIPFVLTIPEAAAGFFRIDNALLTTSNTIELQQGLPSETIALRPTYPETNILLTSWNVSGNVIDDSGTPIVGTDVVKKSFSSTSEYNGVGSNVIIPFNPNGYSEIRLINSGLVSISGFDLSLMTGPNAEFPYQGKEIMIWNRTGGNVTLKHEDFATADYPMFLRAETNLVLPDNHILTFKYDAGGLQEKDKSFFSVDEIIGLASVLASKANLVAGKIPASELPSYVDDVLEFANLATFPVSGEASKIYLALDTNLTYRWSGSTYVDLNSSKLNKVSTVDVEKVYIKNADGTQSMKPTSELGGSSVQSVSGDSVDNTNPLNPIINAIPLSGTTVGSPVTGNIEIKSEDSSIVEIFQNDVTNGFRNSLQFNADGPNFSMASRGVEQSFVDLTSGQLNLYTSRYSIQIGSKEAIDGGRGLQGMQDYTPNITDLDYTQKKYVDNLVNTATNTATVTVELVNSLFTDFYAPDDLRINTTNTIFGVGTITLKVNDVAYTLTDLIIKGDKITVETNSESVFNLNIIYE